MKPVLIVLMFSALAITAVACGAPPTPTPAPSPTLPLPTLAPTEPPATPTIAPTPTAVPPPPTAAAPSPTPTRTRVPATPKPAATATPAKPAAPNGSIAYHLSHDSGIDSVYVLNLADSSTTPLVNIGPAMDLTVGTNAAPFAWSPDNSKFAFIATVSLGGSNILRVLDFALNTTQPVYSSDSNGGLSSPTWSPDGSQIAFVRMTPNQQGWAIDKVNANGTSCQAGKSECEIRNVPGEQYRGGLQWAKQGLFVLAYNTTGTNDVYSMYGDGSSTTNLTNSKSDDGAPVWSPDGKQIAFTSNRDGHPQIYVMNADGSGVHRVSQSDVADFSPTWSPDGNWIAFASTRNAVTNVFMMDTHGGNVTQLTKTGGDRPVWSH